jgi:hypothetical protein
MATRVAAREIEQEAVKLVFQAINSNSTVTAVFVDLDEANVDSEIQEPGDRSETATAAVQTLLERKKSLPQKRFTSMRQMLVTPGIDRATIVRLVPRPYDEPDADQPGGQPVIGDVTVTPTVAAPGQSVLIVVSDLNGKDVAPNDVTTVRINGTYGGRQYLQFDKIGRVRITISAARDGRVESRTVFVDVVDPEREDTKAENLACLDSDGLRAVALRSHPAIKAPPILNLARHPRDVYRVAVAIGQRRFPSGFSAGWAENKPGGIGTSVGALSDESEVSRLGPMPAAISIPPYALAGLGGSDEALMSIAGSPSSENALRSDAIRAVFRDSVAAENILVSAQIGALAIEPPVPGSRDLLYHWDFGDGTNTTTRLPIVEHDFERLLAGCGKRARF